MVRKSEKNRVIDRIKRARSEISDLDLMEINCEDDLLKIVSSHISRMEEMLRKDTRYNLGEDIWSGLREVDKYYALLWGSNWIYAAKIQQTIDIAEAYIVNEFMWVLVGKTFAVE